MTNPQITIIGAGAWGTAFAIHLARHNYNVKLWIFEKDLAEQIQKQRINNVFLPDFELSENISPANDIAQTLENAEFVFWAVPTQHLRDIASIAKNHAANGAVHCVLGKGIERQNWQFPFQILSSTLNLDDVVVLSGPSFAEEVAQGKPTVLVAAAKSAEPAQKVQYLVSDEHLRVYRNDDPLGVSLGGAYKNIIAIGTGITDGLGLGHNTRAALVTRGLSEIVRFGEAIGAKRETFFGAAGLGDLVLTCTSEKSRNYSVGFRIGRGETFQQIASSMMQIAEGVHSTHGVLHIAREHNIELPIAIEVHNILWEGKKPVDGVRSLMSRPLKAEW